LSALCEVLSLLQVGKDLVVVQVQLNQNLVQNRVEPEISRTNKF
jgi:hypothetical protein